MKTVEAGVKTLQQGLEAARELSLSIRNVVDAFRISEFPSKSELQKMLHEADLQGRWYIYHGFCAIAFRREGAFWKGYVEQELQVLLFSIEECIESSMDATDDPKELRRILRWTDKDEHPKTREKLIKKLAQSLLQAIPEADDETLKWIDQEGCIKDHTDFFDVLKAVNEESDKRASRYVETNEDTQRLLAVLEWNASYDTKRKALRKALANTTEPEAIFSIAAYSSGNEDKCRAWDKFVDNVGDDTKRLWIAVDAEYSEVAMCNPRSKALKKLLSLNKGFENVFKINRYRLRSQNFPYVEMRQTLQDMIKSTKNPFEVTRIYKHILEKDNGETKVYREEMLAAVRRLYELSQSK